MSTGGQALQVWTEEYATAAEARKVEEEAHIIGRLGMLGARQSNWGRVVFQESTKESLRCSGTTGFARTTRYVFDIAGGSDAPHFRLKPIQKPKEACECLLAHLRIPEPPIRKRSLQVRLALTQSVSLSPYNKRLQQSLHLPTLVLRVVIPFLLFQSGIKGYYFVPLAPTIVALISLHQLPFLSQSPTHLSRTQKGGYQCLGCTVKTYDDDSAFRVHHTGFETDNNAKRAEARAWKDWVNLPFKAKTSGNLDGLKQLGCERYLQRLAPLTFMLDRLPPFLTVSYGLEQISAQA
ncbi:hypothetical protein HO173_012027 [Letharia columbiana]|uniref:Uncharacterized protein n=1 Tax=Letharia columbiana TaxID=112416 RepID=A0A8H6CQF0_9LECA|nr:uncharacterized protein HO173_012027 [Letharia columbiana]KAF6227697.1 hypothetical protein HO173_012027 [Letharia columbiana]